MSNVIDMAEWARKHEDRLQRIRGNLTRIRGLMADLKQASLDNRKAENDAVIRRSGKQRTRKVE